LRLCLGKLPSAVDDFLPRTDKPTGVILVIRQSLPLAFPISSIFRITSSRLKLVGFWRGGNSLKLSNPLAANACIGTKTNARRAALERVGTEVVNDRAVPPVGGAWRALAVMEKSTIYKEDSIIVRNTKELLTG